MDAQVLTGHELQALVAALQTAASTTLEHGFNRPALIADASRIAGAGWVSSTALGPMHAAALVYAAGTVEALAHRGYGGLGPEELRALAARVAPTN